VGATDNQSYYDAFADRYEAGRDRGYHRLIDDQAAELVRRVGLGRDVLEVGCGTGLVLMRIARFARRAEGVDLSPRMLERARARGLQVQLGDAAALPYADASFDVVCSFKVLAHVADLDASLREMARVVRPGGFLVFDLYNRTSLRWLGKRLLGPRATSERFDEGAIGTRYVEPGEVEGRLPEGTELVARAGIRIAVPHPAVLRIPGLGAAARRLEWRLMDSRLARYAGFLVYTLRRTGTRPSSI
jgi:SAM-dependent methyltransferase